MTERNSHSLRNSSFFRMPSPRKIAELLYVSPDALEGLANGDDNYRCWEEEKSCGGIRKISAPSEPLKAVQSRISELLQRIEMPDFVMAPRKGRSYVNNAEKHLGQEAFRLLDLTDFFPTCTYKRVFWFFKSKLETSPDVASILTKIACYDGHLPQGSPCSPILAYFAYLDMWEEIDDLVTEAGCIWSLYADDITISGKSVPEEMVWKIKQCLFRYGHSYSRRKERSATNKPVEVTGVIVSGDELLLPNRQHKKLATVKRDFVRNSGGPVKQKLERQLRGRQAQAKQILKHSVN